MGGDGEGLDIEQVIVRQQGVIAREQAVEGGVSRRSIEWRLADGTWRTIGRGVYFTLGGKMPFEARVAAVLATTGPNSRLSHKTGAWALKLWGFTEPPVTAPSHARWVSQLTQAPIEVTTPRSRRCRTTLRDPLTGDDIPYVTHRGSFEAQDLKPGETTFECTTHERTMCDLAEAFAAGRIKRWQLAAAYEECFRRGYWQAMQDRASSLLQGRQHLAALLDLLQRRGAKACRVDSPLEAACDDILWNAGLRAERQHRVYERERVIAKIDLAFPEYGVGIELDGNAAHERRLREDSERSNAIVAARSWTLLHFTFAHVVFRPEYVLEKTFAALRARGWREPASVAA